MSNKIIEELETKEFYDLMQTYRHSPITKQDDVYAAYQSVKAYIERLLAQEREKVRESLLPFISHKVSCRWTTPPHNWYEKDIRWQPGKECTCGLGDIIRQLDLTAPSSTEEGPSDV